MEPTDTTLPAAGAPDPVPGDVVDPNPVDASFLDVPTDQAADVDDQGDDEPQLVTVELGTDNDGRELAPVAVPEHLAPVELEPAPVEGYDEPRPLDEVRKLAPVEQADSPDVEPGAVDTRED